MWQNCYPFPVNKTLIKRVLVVNVGCMIDPWKLPEEWQNKFVVFFSFFVFCLLFWFGGPGTLISMKQQHTVPTSLLSSLVWTGCFKWYAANFKIGLCYILVLRLVQKCVNSSAYFRPVTLKVTHYTFSSKRKQNCKLCVSSYVSLSHALPLPRVPVSTQHLWDIQNSKSSKNGTTGSESPLCYI